MLFYCYFCCKVANTAFKGVKCSCCNCYAMLLPSEQNPYISFLFLRAFKLVIDFSEKDVFFTLLDGVLDIKRDYHIYFKLRI